MEHGVDAYFTGRRRNLRRLSGLSAVLSFAGACLLLLAHVPTVRRALQRTPLLQPGFEGRTRYVERIRIATGPGASSEMRDVGRVVTRPATAAEAGTPVASLVGPREGSSREAAPLPGQSTSGGEIRIRAEVRRSGGAVFQSEELVIEHMVLPDYPEEVWGRGIAGRVTVYARIDSLGRVREVEVLRGLHPVVDEAVRAAVMQYRFRPYHEAGRPVALHVRLTFRFTL
jgi:TonB family protein